MFTSRKHTLDLSTTLLELRAGRPVLHDVREGNERARQRAAVAAGLLQRYGAERVIHVVEGGVPTRTLEGRPTEQPETATA